MIDRAAVPPHRLPDRPRAKSERGVGSPRLRHERRGHAERSAQLVIVRTAVTQENIVLAPAGEIDIATGAPLRLAICAALAERPAHLTLDLVDVPFADSELVHALWPLSRHRLRTPSVMVAGANHQIARLLAVCGLSDLCSDGARHRFGQPGEGLPASNE